MHDALFDGLTRRLSLTISRRRTVQSLAALAGALAPSLVPEASEASRAKKHCLKRGGLWAGKGDPASPCHCAYNCANDHAFNCHGDTTCLCRKTVEGRGYCAQGFPGAACTTSSQCGADHACILEPVEGCCGTAGCLNSTQCIADPCRICIKGTCHQTACMARCPT
jgi:hypothetical protein